MLIDKIPWIDHEGTPIFGVHIHPTGGKLVTCGSDNKVKVWNTEAILHEDKEKDPNTHKLLSTLSDHCGAVMAAQFSHDGKYLASGSDDQLVIVYELRAGRGQAAFGSSNNEANIENWKALHSFRAHAKDVVGLCWSPDDTLLASASLDNTVMIWNVQEGRCIKVLRGHEGFVKGVAWDPLGKYLASQGDDAVIIWRCEDWQLVKRITSVMHRASSSNLRCVLTWSPDGQVLAAARGYRDGRNVAPLISRSDWSCDHCYVGHKGPVTVAAFNPKMYFSRKRPASEEAFRVCAVGSHDRATSVWHADEASPVTTIKKIFDAGVLDMCWSPDGYNLFVASYDGSLACARFQPEELGKQLSDGELQELQQQLYGNMGNRARVLAETPEQLMLEADTNAAAAPDDPFARLNNRLAPQGRGAAAAGLKAGKPAADSGPKRVQPQPVNQNTAPSAAGDSGTAAAAAQPAPVRNRIQPTQLARPAAAAAAAPAAGTRQRDPDLPPAKRQHTMPTAAPTPAALPARTAAAPAGAAAPAAGGPAAAPAGTQVLQPPPVLQLVFCELGEQYNALTGARDLITLQANNRYRGTRGQAAAELLCTSGGKLLWRDIVPGQVLHLLGTSSFSAVATAAGELLVYSPAGRRLMPSIFRGHAACFARVHGASSVLLLTADGTLKLLDLLGHKCELKLDIRGLLGQGVSVLDVRMAPGGAAPLLVLSSGQTLLYHPGLDEWLVAEDSSSALSSFHSLLPLPGRLGLAPGRLLPSENIAAATGQTAAWQAQDRAYLESHIALAQHNRSAVEYKRYMIMYVRELANSGDEARLREVFDDLLGPSKAGSQAQQQDGGWQPQVLGLDKRSFLRAEVLREVGRTRQHQKLVSEYTEYLREAGREGQAAA